MPTLPKQIAETFLKKLAQSEEVTADQVANLKELMEKGKKLKPADIEAIFAPLEDSAL